MRKRRVRDGLVKKCKDIYRETKNKIRVEGEMSVLDG